ncbi:MAG: NADP-dependent oxidoreductase [Vulcanimicrobiota bacterium]
MNAWGIHSYGGPEKLELLEVPEPACRPNELLIAIQAASLNPLDWKLREGMLRRIRPTRFPLLLGNDLSGTVERVGDQVEGFAVGDEVFARVPKSSIGTLAEKIAVHSAAVAHKPGNLSHQQAASIPLAGLTAWQALHDVGELQAGQKVLIQAGAGGVGSLAIQLAHLAGAEVATTASAAKHELVRSLGADHAIDYRKEAFEKLLHGYDLVLDTLGGETLIRSFDILKPGGKVVSIAGPLDPYTAEQLQLNGLLRRAIRIMSWSVRRRARQKDCHYRYLFMRPDGKQLAHLGELLRAGQLRPLVDKVYPFAQVKEAFAYAETGHASGKVIIEIG